MKSFTEWLSKTDDVQDDDLITNQLDQFADRIKGILFNVSEEKREELINKLISNLQK